MEEHMLGARAENCSLSIRRCEPIAVWAGICLVKCCRNPALEWLSMPVLACDPWYQALVCIPCFECESSARCRPSPVGEAVVENAIASFWAHSKVTRERPNSQTDIYTRKLECSNRPVCQKGWTSTQRVGTDVAERVPPL